MKKNTKYIFFFTGIVIGALLTLGAIALFSGPAENNGIIKTEPVEEEHNKAINISQKVMREFGIEVQTAGPEKLTLHKDLTGEIVPNPYEVAHIIPRFAGIVKSVYKKIGDKVKKGDVIAVIESNESLVQYKVKSLISGTILELHMTPGELIGDEQHVVQVANLKDVWAELNVYQKDLGEVKIGQKVEIFSPHSRNVFSGKLFYISPVVNEATRTAITRVKLDNRKGIWKPGMFISGKVFTSIKTVPLAVPKNAVQILNGQKVVFVKSEKGFEPQPVTLGIENGDFVEILDGLHPGDKYVSKGAYTFKSEILKDSFGGDEE